MTYQNCAAIAQAPDQDEETARRLREANINPATGLASDYLNHFNEAIMLLDMLPGCPECLDDLLAWKPMSYREHFAASRFKSRGLAIAAYDAADPAVRGSLDHLADTMTEMLEATRAALRSGMPHDAACLLAAAAAAWLRPQVARAGGIINGDAAPGTETANATQAMVDGLLK